MTIRKTWLAAVAAAATAFSVPSFAEENFTLRLAQTWGPNSPILGETVEHMAEMANLMSDGRLTIRIDASNKHKAPFGIFDLVRNGQYDMGHTASYYYKGTIPNAMYFTTVPFG
ncbi:MAG TPA: ABC transporter substrate-binding protein, partial [Marinobacter sp.]|nr:ABC transporter substrate-binding protein [Marinobacter sp.]